MFELIKSEDKEVLNNSNFAKNAIFFKDMLSFMAAYDEIMQHKGNLPNFCYLHDKSICLEGVCLLIKMYATEFKFETIKLTLDYLKILYYSVSSYSVDGKTVDHETIVEEFDKYREASIDFCEKNKTEVIESENEYNKEKNKFFAAQTKGKKLEISSKFYAIFSIILYVFSPAAACLTWLFLSNKSDIKQTVMFSLIALLSVLIVATNLKILSKKLLNISAEVDYKSQVLRKNNEQKFENLQQIREKFNKIICEKYEYKTCFSEIFSRYGKVLTIAQILEKARSYKLLSYNIVHDLNKLFISQQKEIDKINLEIENVVLTDDSGKDFASIYATILNQDWLYYNAEIRMHFLRKFTDYAEKQHQWKLDFEQQKINPFDIKIRDLSKERIAYLYSSKNKVITANLDDFMHTKYLKNLENLNLANNFSVESLKDVKSHYLRYFYNSYILEAFRDKIYTKKGKGFVVNTKEINELEMIPTFINLKLKLIENSLGLGNSDASVIKSMANSLFIKADEVEEDNNFTEDDIIYPEVTSSETIIDGDNVIFVVNGKKIIGKKIV